MKVVVTGGSGFVGSHLIPELSGRHDVFNLDIKPPTVGHANYLQADITDQKSLKNLFKGPLGDTDAIVHLAALSRERESNLNPQVYFDVNISGTMNILNACINSNCRKFILASSYLVYGDSDQKLPRSEKSPIQPKSIYAITKATGEMLCNNVHLENRLEIVCFRKSVIFGEGDQSKRVVELYLSRARQGENLDVLGNKTLDFVFVKDVVRAYIRALENPVQGTFNIGSGSGTALRDLASWVKSATNSQALVVDRPPGPTDVEFYVADITRMSRELDVLPTKDVKTFVEEQVQALASISN